MLIFIFFNKSNFIYFMNKMKFNIFIFLFISISFLVIEAESKSKKSKNRIKTQQNNILVITIAVLIIGTIIYILAYVDKKHQERLRRQKQVHIKQVLSTLQLYRKDRACTLSQMQKNEMIEWFSKQNWILQQTTSKQKKSLTKLNIVSIKRKKQFVDGQRILKDYYDAFYVKMQASNAYIYGVFMFQKFYMTFLFEKSISNKKNTHDTYNLMIFQGVLKKGSFSGKWYYTNTQTMQLKKLQLLQNMENGNKTQRSNTSSQKYLLQLSHNNQTNNKKLNIHGEFSLYHS